MPTQSVSTLRCARIGCFKPVPPVQRRHGAPRRFCSSECRYRAWVEEHPRLMLSRPAGRKVSQEDRILERLRQGPATHHQLIGISLSYGSRVRVLRTKGYVIRQEFFGRTSVYRLEE